MLELLVEALLELLGLQPPKQRQQQRRPAGPPPAPQGGVNRVPEPRRERSSPGVPPPILPRPRATYPARPAQEPAAMPRTPRAQQPATKTPSGLDFAARLRNNPEAAREAFVYGEIFGRPLGDR